jgi:hypothetical protein
MTMKARRGRVDITPRSRRMCSATSVGRARHGRVIRPLFVTALVLRDAGTTIVVCAADLVGLTTQHGR